MPTALRLIVRGRHRRGFPRRLESHERRTGIGFGRAGTTCECSNAIARGVHDDHTRRSEEHTSELQSHSDLVCRLLLEKKKKKTKKPKEKATKQHEPEQKTSNQSREIAEYRINTMHNRHAIHDRRHQIKTTTTRDSSTF